ncbi:MULTISPECIES: histidinol-phosphate transaminase [Paenibacillus]|jgi:histidinol-phosphate aminotransferase|uniref:histidinol-phosphate transaminase n=1 Tax=Paenibacillus TaxID=44249 RepID=UPI0003D2B2CB|nr:MULTISPECIES: histidinol-phosphate transaminase [Paenibacillus]AIW40452.1 histidinol-phosphate aminotransferase [Paenibacillus polymyxa CR1]ALA42727.1 histidinol-phosphate aminotransferase [Paenibacillus peoriae]APB75473.1 histidinol-phosphate transaminase [Paenibacillus polymyxa]APQ59998.1 histidinol-phosphate aminotransferase [Paenibacillus polymyxa]MBP1176907.1 histidinol-phosphate aminotransferase [Paenibacillus sp. PvR133]
MQPKPHIVHLPVYQPGKPIEDVKRELGLDEVIKLASNENPYGSSPKVLQAIQQEFANISVYPDGSAVALTQALAKRTGLKEEQFIYGCGSDEIIALITRAFLLPGEESIMADQTFSVYKSNVEIEGAVAVEVPLRDGVHDLDAMLSHINDRTKIIWICNPNNPTGTIVPEAELIAFLDQVPKHIMVVLDEAYAEFVTDRSYPDGIRLLPAYENLVVLRTFSKIYGLASLRIGYGMGAESIIRLINQVREPFNTSRVAQAAAIAALEDQEFVQECRDRNAEGRAYLQNELKRLGLESFPAHGNFIMLDVRRPSGEVFQELLRKGVIIRAGHHKYPTYIRVSVGSQPQNELFIRALEQVLGAEAAKVRL